MSAYTIDVLEAIRRLSEILTEQEETFELIESLAARYNDIALTSLLVLVPAKGPAEYGNASGLLNERVLEAITQIRAQRPSRMFRSIDQGIRDLTNLEARLPDPIRVEVGNARLALTQFHDAYEALLGDYAVRSAVSVLAIADDFVTATSKVVPMMISVEEGFGREISIPVESATFELLLTSSRDLAHISRQLSALVQLYELLCGLLDVDASEHPLQAAHIASGSLWIKLFGESRAVSMMIRLVEGGLGYLHRNFTNEGKISAIPRKLEALDAALRFSEGLAQAGVDPAAMREELQKSSVLIAKQLNVLLAGEPNVRVNGTEISLATELRAGYLEGGRKLLPPGDEAPEDTE